jgi:hypothetical protein
MICFIVGSFEGYNRLGLTKFGRNNYKKFYCNYFFRKSARNMDLSMDFTNSYGSRPQDDFKLTKG